MREHGRTYIVMIESLVDFLHVFAKKQKMNNRKGKPLHTEW